MRELSDYLRDSCALLQSVRSGHCRAGIMSRFWTVLKQRALSFTTGYALGLGAGALGVYGYFAVRGHVPL